MSKALLQSSEIFVCYILCKFLAKFWFIAHNISIQIQKMNMNFATTQSTISSCHDVSLDINLFFVQNPEIPNSQSSSPHLPGVRPVCPKVSRAAKRVHCPTVPIVPPPWIDPRPPALLTSSSARNCPIGQFGAGLKPHGLWINRGTQGQGRKEFVGPFHLNPRKWVVFKAG